jgi:A/G-specific adenine glycosylase
MMDLGATICSPRAPSCAICPVVDHCKARGLGVAGQLPRKAPKRARPTRHGTAFIALRGDGAVLLRRRPPKGLLGGMLEAPSSAWLEAPAGLRRAPEPSPLPADWRLVAGTVSHTFTHFQLELAVYVGRVEDGAAPAPAGCRWHRPEELPGAALPSVMRKVLAHALGADHCSAEAVRVTAS